MAQVTQCSLPDWPGPACTDYENLGLVPQEVAHRQLPRQLLPYPPQSSAGGGMQRHRAEGCGCDLSAAVLVSSTLVAMPGSVSRNFRGKREIEVAAHIADRAQGGVAEHGSDILAMEQSIDSKIYRMLAVLRPPGRAPATPPGGASRRATDAARPHAPRRLGSRPKMRLRGWVVCRPAPGCWQPFKKAAASSAREPAGGSPVQHAASKRRAITRVRRAWYMEDMAWPVTT